MNSPPACSQEKPLHNFSLFPHLCHFVLWGAAFLPHAYCTYLQQCQFYGVITSLVCVFSILTFFFFFVRVHCVRLSPRVYLCSLPPPLSLRLSSVITALDSSSDGKCFSIRLSPASPPPPNLHLSPVLTKQMMSWLL